MQNRVVESDKPHSRRLYRRKGWKGFVHSYKTYTTNGNGEKVEWDQSDTSTIRGTVVKKDDFGTIIKF